MKAKIAVVTTSGRAYFLVVNELKRRSIPFLSLKPGEPVPIRIKVVITTELEKDAIHHDGILIYREGSRPETVINEASRIVQGKEYYESIVIGLDPGEVFGLAVLADGMVIETGNCFSVDDAVRQVRDVLRNLEMTPAASISVKIGDGVPTYNEQLLRAFDEALPANVMLESVSETGTDKHLDEAKHRRGLRDIVSATRIAGRHGQRYVRRRTYEPDS